MLLLPRNFFYFSVTKALVAPVEQRPRKYIGERKLDEAALVNVQSKLMGPVINNLILCHRERNCRICKLCLSILSSTST